MKKENLNSLIFSIYSLIACGFLLLGKADCIAKSDLCSSPFQGPYVGGNIGYGSAQVQQYTNAQTVPAGTASIEENVQSMRARRPDRLFLKTRFLSRWAFEAEEAHCLTAG